MISYSAQTRLAGRRRMLDVWYPKIRQSPLRSLIDVRRGFGCEAFTFANGSMIMLASGTEASDHGDTLHMGVIDEAWAQRDSTIEQALKPAMLTVAGAQLFVVSTAGNEYSSYFRGKVDEGRARCETGVIGSSAYIGYSAPDDADPGDPETWRRCMPALGITVSEETVASDFETMDLPEFRRACLCQWPEVARLPHGTGRPRLAVRAGGQGHHQRPRRRCPAGDAHRARRSRPAAQVRLPPAAGQPAPARHRQRGPDPAGDLAAGHQGRQGQS
jgi:hypothetical protein